ERGYRGPAILDSAWAMALSCLSVPANSLNMDPYRYPAEADNPVKLSPFRTTNAGQGFRDSVGRRRDDRCHSIGPRSTSHICRSRHLSAVSGCFLRELHAGGEAEFGVDVGEVGLHGAG